MSYLPADKQPLTRTNSATVASSVFSRSFTRAYHAASRTSGCVFTLMFLTSWDRTPNEISPRGTTDFLALQLYYFIYDLYPLREQKRNIFFFQPIIYSKTNKRNHLWTNDRYKKIRTTFFLLRQTSSYSPTAKFIQHITTYLWQKVRWESAFTESADLINLIRNSKDASISTNKEIEPPKSAALFLPSIVIVTSLKSYNLVQGFGHTMVYSRTIR